MYLYSFNHVLLNTLIYSTLREASSRQLLLGGQSLCFVHVAYPLLLPVLYSLMILKSTHPSNNAFIVISWVNHGMLPTYNFEEGGFSSSSKSGMFAVTPAEIIQQ